MQQPEIEPAIAPCDSSENILALMPEGGVHVLANGRRSFGRVLYTLHPYHPQLELL